MPLSTALRCADVMAPLWKFQEHMLQFLILMGLEVFSWPMESPSQVAPPVLFSLVRNSQLWWVLTVIFASMQSYRYPKCDSCCWWLSWEYLHLQLVLCRNRHGMIYLRVTMSQVVFLYVVGRFRSFDLRRICFKQPICEFLYVFILGYMHCSYSIYSYSTEALQKYHGR